jgi:putative FmdB family regulatory protein
MPIYEYECNKCSHRFELRRKFGEDGGAACPQCQGVSQRVFSAVPIVFKGSGFYVTDCRKESGGAATGSEPKSGVKSESKPAKIENKVKKVE